MTHFGISCPSHPDASLEAFLLTDELTYGQNVKRPAVLVLPGGGYVYLCPREAEPVAISYANAGFHAFILRYSVAHKAAGFTPLEEISWAIGCLRENADRWNIEQNQIAVCGFSAGGHLALASGLLAQNKPNAMILGYPAASAPNMPGFDFMLKILTGKDNPCNEDAQPFDLVPKITKDAPPVFLAATSEDILTTYGALPIVNAYSRLGMHYELHIFQHGPHGYSLANTTSANGSSKILNEAFSHWHHLSVSWLKSLFGQPEFTDVQVSQMMNYLRKYGYVAADDNRATFG